jgi:DNA-binding NarL/FixJ family response regulator
VTRRVIKQFTKLPPRTPPTGFDELTSREHEVLQLLAQGLSNAEIGTQLYISETTVKTHVTRVLQKLEVRDRAQAIVVAYRTGLVDED